MMTSSVLAEPVMKTRTLIVIRVGRCIHNRVNLEKPIIVKQDFGFSATNHALRIGQLCDHEVPA